MQRDEQQAVKCVGVIIDGNRRWAKANGLPQLQGHEAGYKKVKEFVRWAADAGIHTAVVYAFSSENWSRSPEEVSYLMTLFEKLLMSEVEELKKKGVRISVIGQRERLSPRLQKLIQKVEEETKHLTPNHLFVAISYGGRDEIVDAAQRLFVDMKNGNDVTISKELFAKYLWTHEMPDPDIIIRTGGEMRLSNFLPWQSVYSELFFHKKMWPAFEEQDFKDILAEFYNRQRRFGK